MVKNLEDLRLRYQKRAKECITEADRLKQRYNRFAILRLLIFVGAILLGVYCWSWHWIAGTAFTVLFLLVFYRFVQSHLRIRRREQHLRDLHRINRRELDFLDHRFDAGDTGQAFVDSEHPYSLDLDIFGEYSLFQYINRGVTTIGQRCLAGYLRSPAAEPEISRRRDSIRDLAPRLDWRQNLEAFSREADDDIRHLDELEAWLKKPPFARTNPGLRAAPWFIPLWMAAGIALWIYLGTWQIMLLFLALPAFILSRINEKVTATHQQTTKAEKILEHYAHLIQHIEKADFKSVQLIDLQSIFKAGEESASKRIRRLAYYISQLNVRFNIFAILLNVFGMWDVYWVIRLERWKAREEKSLMHWFDALAEFEALGSLATLHYNHPDWTFAEITDQQQFAGEQLGHPLISHQQRVSNDLEMPTRGHIKLITGSNMAGKSTFLRTVGVNIVLAMTGAPVCAARMQLPLLRVYTSMRTQDDLHESTSSFYAELRRLGLIIEAVEAGEPVFFLLDEILKGTNSRDRHTGAKALIHQLIDSRGGGLIATHDLELGQLEARAGGAIENLCMEVAIQGDQLHFDYKLRKGVSQSFNATLLMKRMGIRVDGS